MPSPPDAVSSSHQAMPSCWLASSLEIDNFVRCRQKESRVGSAQASQQSSCATRDLYPSAPRLRLPANERAQASDLPTSEPSSSSGDKPRHIVPPSPGVLRSVQQVRRLLAHACWLVRKAAIEAARPARAAAPVGAYCWRSKSCAFDDHGISSQSRHSQSVASSSHRPDFVTAA